MKSTYAFGILFAFCFIIIKMSLHLLGIYEGNIRPTTFINILFLLAAISIGLYQYRKRREEQYENLLTEIKRALQSGITYTVIVCGFLFVYYQYIDATMLESMREERLDDFRKQLDNPKELAQIRHQNEAFELMSSEDIYQEIKTNIDQFISARAVFLISLLAMMMMSIIYSIFIAFIYKKVLFRE